MDFLIYDAKVAVLIAVFYMFYRVLLAKETFHRVNRVVLLATAIASFVMPLCVITMHETVMMPMPQMSVEVGEPTVEAAVSQTPWWQTVLPILFFIGMAVVLGHTLLSIVRILMLIKRSEQHPLQDGITVCVTGNTALSPFSWMHYIVMNRSDYEQSDAAILAHERGHIRLRHSWDVLLVDTLTALQWFNPAMWMLRSDLRAIHEYEADAAVLSQGINARQYQYLLISKAAGIGGYYLANGISHSTLKNRINMMLHTKSDRSRLLKVLALLPIVAVALAVNAERVIDVRYQQPQAPQKVTTKTDEKVFEVVEQMPSYPGGMEALMKFLTENIHYPKEAENKGIQGHVVAKFVVDTDGSLRDPKIIKSVDPLLDKEALRIINAMPKWIPGKQNGKVVPVNYTIPIRFCLPEGGEKKPAEAVVRTLEPENKAAIRVIGSSGNQPLFIVDGKKVSAEQFKATDPKTIDKMEVLKDKASIEKYGQEGKNGVVIVTLKKDS